MKKQITRDSLIVIPTFIFICVWLFVELNPNIDPTPGTDYGMSMAINLLIPLFLIGAAQTAYAALLIADTIRLSDKSRGEKALICIGMWFAVMYLFFAVYIYRLVRFIRQKNKSADDRAELRKI